MKTRKNVLTVVSVLLMVLATMTGCNSGKNAVFSAEKEIGVISREKGSGTRGAFIELFGIEQKDEDGNKIDHTTPAAVVNSSTGGIMTTVAGDRHAIGYISLGSLNDTVKAVQINGAEATAENIKNGSYEIARPFNIVTKETLSEEARDFISFILSADGQQVIEDDGYLPISDAPAYTGDVSSGKVLISGSSSVAPVMEKLKEAYLQKNPGVGIDINMSDSSTGVADAIDGTCDIGMASRELKDSEVADGAISTVIARDGIAVIVNKDNPVDDLTTEQVRDIFTGAVTVWDQIIGE